MFRILLVDDTRAVHAFVKALLQNSSIVGGKKIEFVDAFNGEEAVKIAGSAMKQGQAFDLVLLDWEMPVKTGPECLVELINMGFKTPIVMMTTKNNPDDIARLLGLGASEYLLKPFTVDIIKEKIEYVCGQVFQNVG